MKQPFSPLIDFYPADFGLDLNGKRFTWQAVVLLPFIDEPRLVRILGPLLKQLKPSEKVRNRRGNELVFGPRATRHYSTQFSWHRLRTKLVR
jgi:5'-3' exonuclease